MEDLLGVLMVPMVVFMVVVAPIWLVLHYRAKGRIGVEMDNYWFTAAAFASLQKHLPDAVFTDATALVKRAFEIMFG